MQEEVKHRKRLPLFSSPQRLTADVLKKAMKMYLNTGKPGNRQRMGKYQ